jgi:hypothetical protein
MTESDRCVGDSDVCSGVDDVPACVLPTYRSTRIGPLAPSPQGNSCQGASSSEHGQAVGRPELGPQGASVSSPAPLSGLRGIHSSSAHFVPWHPTESRSTMVPDEFMAPNTCRATKAQSATCRQPENPCGSRTSPARLRTTAPMGARRLDDARTYWDSFQRGVQPLDVVVRTWAGQCRGLWPDRTARQSVPGHHVDAANLRPCARRR